MYKSSQQGPSAGIMQKIFIYAFKIKAKERLLNALNCLATRNPLFIVQLKGKKRRNEEIKIVSG
jgi:hypothetical protein